MFDHPSFDQHERVVFAHDAATGLPPGGMLQAFGRCADSLRGQYIAAREGARLQSAGVLCAPDYVINAGGIIRVGREYLTEIFTRSSAIHRPASERADVMARQLLLAEAR